MLIFRQKPFQFCIPPLKTPQPVLPKPTPCMCKAQQGGSLFETQDNTKDFKSINTFTFSHGPMYV